MWIPPWILSEEKFLKIMSFNLLHPQKGAATNDQMLMLQMTISLKSQDVHSLRMDNFKAGILVFVVLAPSVNRYIFILLYIFILY